MKKTIIQTITNIFDENKVLKSSSTTEQYVLEAEENYVLKNIKTNKVFWSAVCLNSKAKIADYIEIEVSSTSL
jgi:hypothetical protein